MGERRRQIAGLVELVRAATHEGMVVLGDFNDWHGEVRRALCELLPAWSSLRTFPARHPVFKLDRLFCRPAGALARIWTDREARRASDHLPVIADLRLDSLTEGSLTEGMNAT